MKEKPILFSGPMIRALLDGRKTQTRRVCKDMAKWVNQDCREVRHIDGVPHHFMVGAEQPIERLRCPYGQPGDRLWVRESGVISKLRAVDDKPGLFRHDVPTTPQIGHYWVEKTRAPGASYNAIACNRKSALLSYGAKACPSIHMPRWASRILLEITDVRVERLQSCNQSDAIDEGIEEVESLAMPGIPVWRDYGAPHPAEGFAYPTDSYRSLWDSLKPPAASAWDANPWVWVVEFKRGNVD